MRFSVLGQLQVVSDEGVRLGIPQPRQRALLAVLLLHANQEMSVIRLTESLVGQDGRRSVQERCGPRSGRCASC